MTHFSTVQWRTIYRLGAAGAVSAVLVGLVEIAINFLTSSVPPQVTVQDWFALYQANPFLGLRNMGLLNIFLNLLGILTYCALYAAHRESPYRVFAGLAAVISFLGIGVFLATNRAFPMLALSQQYAAASDASQRAVLLAAGKAMLVEGGSHTPGTFPAFFLSEAAAVVMSVVLLRSRVLGRAAGWSGLVGFSILLIFETLSSFFTGLSAAAVGLAMVGGLLSMAWYLIIARNLLGLD